MDWFDIFEKLPVEAKKLYLDETGAPWFVDTAFKDWCLKRLACIHFGIPISAVPPKDSTPKKSCPVCHKDGYIREKRPDGDTHCLNCHYSCPSADWDNQ